MDAAHRYGDGSIRLSYISLAASVSALYRTISARFGFYIAAFADIYDAVSHLLPVRTS